MHCCVEYCKKCPMKYKKFIIFELSRNLTTIYRYNYIRTNVMIRNYRNHYFWIKVDSSQIFCSIFE